MTLLIGWFINLSSVTCQLYLCNHGTVHSRPQCYPFEIEMEALWTEIGTLKYEKQVQFEIAPK